MAQQFNVLKSHLLCYFYILEFSKKTKLIALFQCLSLRESSPPSCSCWSFFSSLLGGLTWARSLGGPASLALSLKIPGSGSPSLSPPPVGHKSLLGICPLLRLPSHCLPRTFPRAGGGRLAVVVVGTETAGLFLRLLMGRSVSFQVTALCCPFFLCRDLKPENILLDDRGE